MGSYFFAASPSTGNDSSKNTSSSRFIRTVCLHDWWLIKAKEDFNGKILAVGGITSRGKQAVRVFSSAPIVKRHDIFTLETADGVYIVIKGLINRLRTSENGFSSEVFDHFLFGFPHDWKECGESCFVGEGNNLMRTPILSTLQQEASQINEKTISEDICDSSGGMLIKRNLTHDQKILSAEPSRCHMMRYSQKIDSKGNKKGSGMSAGDQKNTNPSIINQFISVGTSGAENNVKPSALNRYISVETSDMNFTISSERPESSKMAQKENESRGMLESESANLCTASLPEGPGIALRCIDKKLCGANSSSMSAVGVDGMHEEFWSAAPIGDNPIISKLSNSYIDNNTKSPMKQSDVELDVISQSKVDINIIKAVPTNVNSIIQKQGNSEKEKFVSRSHMKHTRSCTRCDGTSKSEVLADEEKFNQPTSVKNAKPHERDISEAISSQFEGNKIPTCRSRNSRSKQKKPQSALKFNLISMGSDHVRNVGDDATCVSGGKHVSTIFNYELQQPVNELMGGRPNDVSQKNCKFSSVGTDVKREQSLKHDRGGLNNGIKSTHNSDRSSTLLGDANCANNLKTGGSKRKNSTKNLGSSGQQMKESSLSPEVKAKCFTVSPESLSYKTSRSGRLLIPTMEFWRNQKAVYDAERQVTGIQEGVHVVKFSRGSKSGPPKKRRLFD